MNPHDDEFPATCSSSPLDICATAEPTGLTGSGIAGTAFDAALSHSGVIAIDLAGRVQRYASESRHELHDTRCGIDEVIADERLAADTSLERCRAKFEHPMNFGGVPDFVPTAPTSEQRFINRIGSVLPIELDDKQMGMLEQLHRSGVFGLTVEEVAQGLILAGLRKAIADGWIEL